MSTSPPPPLQPSLGASAAGVARAASTPLPASIRLTRDLSRAELGRAGEQLAVAHLISRGWSIVGRNVRLGATGELDIVAREDETLVFCEVKTRRSFVTGVPQAAVTPTKLSRLRRLIGAYLMETAVPHRDVRLDVIAVHALPDGGHTIDHLMGVG